MTTYKKASFLFLSVCLFLFGLTGCVNPAGGPNPGGEPVGERAVEFAGYAWDVKAGTAVVNNNGISIAKNDAYGIAIQLADKELAAIAETYPNGFYVESWVKIDTYVGKDAKNFGLASHIGKTADDKDNFYYAGINFNGRTQLGTQITDKGAQFGSLASDTDLFKQTEQYWKLRYEYKKDTDNDIITGYINDIQFNKSSTTSYAIPAGEKVASGSIGFVTSGEAFTVKSFKIGSLTEERGGIKMQSDDFPYLQEGSVKYLMMMENKYKARVEDDPVEVTVTIIPDGDFSVNSTDPSVVHVEKNDGKFVMTPLAQGTAVVTVTSDSVPAQTRVFNCTIEAALSFADTDYELTADDVYPAPEATDIYEDSRLSITFDSKPTLQSGEIIIYKADGTTEVDEIRIGSESDAIRDGTNSGKNNFTLKNFMVQVEGNTVYIIPHFEILQPNTEYVIGIADGVITGTLNGKPFTGFDPEAKRWSFTTRSAHSPSVASLTVGSSDSADYRTLQAALMAAGNNAVITMEEGVYREIVYYKGGKAITIEGPSSNNEFGEKVEIVGINCNAYNGTSHTRASFYWSGSDLTLKNVTLRNAYDRNTMGGTSQSEALFFANGSGRKLVAFNSSFKGHQDTIQTTGKNWFYKCYIEGDTDFIWGTADAALFEECEIKMLNTSNDAEKASNAVIFVARVSNPDANLIPKGYVLFNSKVSAEHPSSYMARNAAAGDFYDQAAVIDTTFTGTLNGNLWLSSSNTKYIDKDAAGNMNVGWKVYGGSGYPTANIDTNAYAGTIKEAVYNKEYNGRNTILNRVFRKTSGMYENASDIWDVSNYEDEFNAVEDDSTIDMPGTVNGANGEYDIASFAADTTGGAPIANGTSSDGYVSWTNIAYHDSTYGARVSGSQTGTITIKAAGKSVISFIGSSYSNGTITVNGTSSGEVLAVTPTKMGTDKTAFAFIYEGTSPDTLTLTITGATYIGKLTVSEWVDEVKAVTNVAVSGAASVVVNETTKFNATVTAAYQADASVTWSSSDTSIAEVAADGTVTGKAAGEATITAASVFNPAVKGSAKIKVVTEGLQPSDSYIWTAAAFNDSGMAIQNKADTWNTLYVDATASGSKFTSKDASWIQVNAGTKIYVPAIAAATVTFTTNGNVSITGFTAESKTHYRWADLFPYRF